MKSGNKKKSVLPLVLGIVLGVLVIVVVPLILFSTNLQPKSDNEEIVVIEIADGSTVSSVATQLEEAGIIKSAFAFKTYAKLNHKSMVQAGTYGFSPNMSVKEILRMLENGEIYTGNQINFTYIEGKPMWWLASEIEAQTNNSADDVYAKLKDEAYLNSLIEKYWFITDEIKNPDIYYSLEGYLFPDTYTFIDANISVEDIFSIMLNKMDEVLTEYKSEIDASNFSIHELLTLASVVEAETMSAQDRAGVAGVFYNRLDEGMSLGSDITTYYAIKVDPHSRDLNYDELEDENAYNTRGPGMEGKLPVGPVCSISREALEGTLRPAQSDALFFVSDKNGKIYFSETNAEHEETIGRLQDEGLWFEY